MRRRTAPGGGRRVTALVAVMLLAAGWLVQAPQPAMAGLTCDPGMNCAKLGFVTTGLGAGTITGHGISCTVDNRVQTGDCLQKFNFAGDYLVVEMTFTAARYSYYLTATGKHAGSDQPVVESVLLLPDDENTQYKEATFGLGYQEIKLEFAGPGSGVVQHSEEGVTCPPYCVVTYAYGATGIIFIAAPDPGSYFISWTGPCAGQNAGCQFDMPRSTTVTVTFGLTPAATATPKPPTPKPATPKPATPGPTVAATLAATAPPTLEPSPSGTAPSTEPSAAAVASAAPTTDIAPTTDPLGTPSPSTGPVSATGVDGGFGSGLLVGLLVAAVVAVVGGFLLWRRRAAPLP